MALEQILALVGFVLVMTGTPGPNNMMLLASGANFGFQRSIPHILGITVGCQILLVAVALGIGQLLLRVPQAAGLLKVLCGVALLYLTWLLVRPAPAIDESAPLKVKRPLSFWQAALFQWVNPKAWMMMITAVATYTQPEAMLDSLLMIGLMFAVVGIPCISIWNLFGASLRRFLANARRARQFNLLMAGLLLASMYPLLV
ncbi:LysE family translocator [Pseudohongiella sp. O18]|uniref:LysE family translocator n=1 Tax=Pseudohongiella sp. O18 TaxID=2904248 RepID=UPI001F2EACD4|nr:LysE family translocator [Pseudohongiella sp. O18]